MSGHPRALDLFACDGGMTRGLQDAGFHVTAVDILDRSGTSPADEFIVADALEVLASRWFVETFDYIHASPPCQIHSAPTKGTNKNRPHTHVDLLGPTRQLLQRYDIPWSLENVDGAPMRKDITLCGEMFGLGVLMHRHFELDGWAMVQPHHPRHRGRVRGWRHGEWFDGPYYACYGKGGGKATVPEAQAAKGIDWTDDEWALREMLPPAYGEAIGRGFRKWRALEAAV